MVFYCKYCGYISSVNGRQCEKCGNRFPFKKANHDLEFYKSKSRSINGDESLAESLFIQDEVTKNPEYNPEIATRKDNVAQEDIKPDSHSTDKDSLNVYTPKCPVCNSPNISRIPSGERIIHGIFFGLFSNTAKSQFECNSCSYKF